MLKNTRNIFLLVNAACLSLYTFFGTIRKSIFMEEVFTHAHVIKG